MIPKRIVGFNLGTKSPLTCSISAVDQRVLLLGCQSRIDDSLQKYGYEVAIDALKKVQEAQENLDRKSHFG